MHSFETTFPYDPDTMFGKLSSALKENGYAILSYVDMKEIIETKLNIPFQKYLLLNVCKPQAGKEIMDEDPRNGLFLPCKIFISPEEKGCRVSVLLVSVLVHDYLGKQETVAKKYEDEIISIIKGIE